MRGFSLPQAQMLRALPVRLYTDCCIAGLERTHAGRVDAFQYQERTTSRQELRETLPFQAALPPMGPRRRQEAKKKVGTSVLWTSM